MFSLIWNLGLLEFSFLSHFSALLFVVFWTVQYHISFHLLCWPMLLNQVIVNCCYAFIVTMCSSIYRFKWNVQNRFLTWRSALFVEFLFHGCLCVPFFLLLSNRPDTILSISKCLSSPDSFILNVRVKNEEDFYRKMGDTMDLSNLPRNHSFYDNTNEKGNFFYHKKTKLKNFFQLSFSSKMRQQVIQSC